MITFCIPSKNNLRYLKMSIPSIRKNSYYTNDIIVYVDQDNDGTVEWLKENNVRYILNNTSNPKGIGNAYDTMFLEAKTDFVMAFHADMALGYHADFYMLKRYGKGKVVCGTCIEPPNLHPPGNDKLIADFGMWPEEFDIDKFNIYVKDLIKINEGKLAGTMFVPWLINKHQHVGHDSTFLSVFEDTDLFRRFILAGYTLEQTWEAYVYHLTCRGGQFEHATKTEDLATRSDEWKRKSNISTREFIRKWGGLPKVNESGEPVINLKYDVGFVVSNCGLGLLAMLEPWCSTIYYKDDYSLITPDYLSKEQPYTKFDLQARIKPYDNEKQNEILVEFDASQLNGDNFALLRQLPEIIAESGEVGEFELDIFKVTIVSLNRYESELINLDSTYYRNQLKD